MIPELIAGIIMMGSGLLAGKSRFTDQARNSDVMFIAGVILVVLSL